MSIAPTEATELYALLDFDGTQPCEGYGHKDGRAGHKPNERGAIYLSSPCGCPGIVLCLSRIQMLEIFPDIKCERCNRYYPRGEFAFTYIPRDNCRR